MWYPFLRGEVLGFVDGLTATSLSISCLNKNQDTCGKEVNILDKLFIFTLSRKAAMKTLVDSK